MPKLTQHQEQKSIKMLLIGDSGAGKTGALASLAQAGYNLNILDYDNGLDILPSVLKGDTEAMDRINYETCTDNMKLVGNDVKVQGPPKAASKGLKLLDHWKTEDEDLGKITEWGTDKILIIDSLTLFSKAAFRHAEVFNASNDKRQVYQAAQALVEGTLALLYSDAIKCHVIITSHITFLDLPNGMVKGYPSSIGKALSPQIARYFNTVLLAKVSGNGANAKRTIKTVPDGMIDLKAPLLLGDLPAELPLATGLATFFKTLKGELS